MTTARHLMWRDLVDLQDGVLTRQQALASGLSAEAWRWRLAVGRWQRVLPGVAVAHTGEVTWQQHAWAAALCAGPGARLAGDAALAVLGLRTPSPPTRLDVAVPVERRARGGTALVGEPPPRLVVRRVTALPSLGHPARHPPVVRAAPAALLAAAWAASDRAAEWRVAASVQQRLVTVPQLRDALGLLPTLRRRAFVRGVLDDVELGAHARSELDLLRLLRRHGLPLPDRLQRPVRAGGTRYLDAWWERQRVVVEVDGAHHVEVGHWAADALRANEVVVAERHDRVVLIRFTTGNLRHDEAAVARQLRALLL